MPSQKSTPTLRSRFMAWVAKRAIEALPDSAKKIRIRRPGSAFVRYPSSSSARAEFEYAPFDMAQIQIAYSKDDYVSQAVDKYVDLCTKEGFKFVGPSSESLQYIKNRFAWMERLSGVTTEALVGQIVYNIVKYGNTILAKARIPANTPIPFRATPIGNRGVVGYYQPLHPGTIKVARRKNGDPIAFEQEVITGSTVERQIFSPEDIVHFPWKRDDGEFFGVPWIWPAIEDVKLLRILESNMETLIRKYIFPILHAQIGMPEPGYEAEDKDIEKAKADFEQMPPEGIWVTPERYGLKSVGMEGEALNIKPYLEYMEKRVFTGLGVPETVMGRGSTANRSTASAQTREMHDRAKAVQKVVEHIFKLHIIDELLREGGYDPIADRDTIGVYLRFNEIDLDALFKKENNAIFKWEHNAKTFEEMREEIGENPEVDESRLYFNMVAIPQARARSEGLYGDPDTNNRQQPENQYGKKPAKTGDKANEGLLEFYSKRQDAITQGMSAWTHMSHALVTIVSRSTSYPKSYKKEFADEIDVGLRSVEHSLRRHLPLALLQGLQQAQDQLGSGNTKSFDTRPPLAALEGIVEQDLDRIGNDLLNRLMNIVKNPGTESLANQVERAVDVTAYRIRFLIASYTDRAFWVGFAYQARANGRKEVDVVHEDDCCGKCKAHEIIDLSVVDLMMRLPPFHPGDCRCKLVLPKLVLHHSPAEEVNT